MPLGDPRVSAEVGRAGPNELVLQWVGDISLNGVFCDPLRHAAVAASVRELQAGLGPCDLRIGNWESPLWGDGGVNVLKMPRVCTTRNAAECLVPLGLDVALLANNHTYDCLEQGFANTIRFFEKHHIRWLGAGTSPDAAAKPLCLERQGLRLALLNYVGADTNPNLPPDAGVYLNMLDHDRALAEVAALAARSHIVLVHLHWGAFELIRYPTVAQRRFARQLVEAGAAVVVCHHAHCLQGHERWNDGYVFHGLGNFLFGCYAGQPGRPWPEIACRTAVAMCVVGAREVGPASLLPCVQKGDTLAWDHRRSRRRHQERLNRALRLPDARYERRWRWEHRLQWCVKAPLRFLRESGGLFAALGRMRKQHVLMMARTLLGLRVPEARTPGTPRVASRPGAGACRPAPSARGHTEGDSP